MIAIVFLGADPPTNFWARAEFSPAPCRGFVILRDHRDGALHIAHFVSL